VLVATGYAWSTLNQLTTGLNRADVIGAGAQPPLNEQNILLVGLDTRTDAQGNPLPPDVLNQLHAGSAADGGDTTDTMIVIHLPAGGGQATAISLPRDSYVNISGGYGKHKINSAYTYGKTAATAQLKAQGESGARLQTDSDQSGAKTAIATVEQFTGLTITHYAAVNLAGFASLSQAVGGVPVCLTGPVHDSYSGANFPAGTQTISGAQALAFVRQRHGLPNGDLDRIKRQQAFMASMAKTVLSAGTLADPATVGNLVAAVKQAIVIDTNWDVLGFAQQLQGMSAGRIRFVTIPVVNISLATPSDGDAVEVDPAQVQTFVRDQVAGSSGAPSPSSGSTPPAPGSTAPAPGPVVDVRNASGVTGLAAQVQRTLTAAGFGQGTVANTAHRSSSVVHYGPGDRTQAQRVAQLLGGMPVSADDTLTPGQLRVYLGADYSASSSPTSVRPAAFVRPLATPPPITAGGVTCVN
jgi:LCP family protein required for cell wall assembly